MRKGAGAALEEITGQRFGRDEDAWRRWWHENDDVFLAGDKAGER